ncbi:hypothetical protein [Nocardia carnea]|uniref:hypothetical protein n=3 Tax=Nocardia carnea TaxID=37328 RepID=UPI0024560A46|nr:hypothetical protein [Nocardia carnea]
MIDWLAVAAAPAPAGSWWKDLLLFAVPPAVVLLAWIGGRYALRNARRTPYERLDVLVKIRSEWPEGLEGRDSLDRSVAHALARIRQIEGDTTHLDTSANARWADYRVALQQRRSAYRRAAFGVATLGTLAAIAVLRFPLWSDIAAERGRRAALTAVYPPAVLFVAALLVTGTALWELNRFRQREELGAYRPKAPAGAPGAVGAETGGPDAGEPL